MISSLPNNWKLKKLGEIGKVIGGGTPKTKEKEYYGGEVPWITPKDLSGYNRKNISYGERNITEKGLKNSSARLLPEGSVLFSSRAPIGYVAIAAQPVSTNQGFKSIIPNEEITTSDFLYYLLINSTEKIKNLGSGSTFSEVSGKVVKNVEINLPPLDEQKSIANILSSFDDKIENNNKIINNLEEQAQAIFKSWFVDFEPFQDEEFVESELGRIPRNWRIATLKEFFPVVTGKKNANIATENGKYPFFTCAQDISYTDDFSFDDHAILVAGNGDFNVKRFKGKFEAYQRTYVLIPSDENLTGLLYHLINHYLKNIVLGYKGSFINYITKGMIEDFKFPFPNKIEEVGIVDVFNTIEKKIAYTKRENIKLEEIRDTLLPKLMSGEIRVDEASEVN